jgi:hypothetical protein
LRRLPEFRLQQDAAGRVAGGRAERAYMNVFVGKRLRPRSAVRLREMRAGASRRLRRELAAFAQAARWLFGIER